ncbi:hypothetical protein GN157_06260 [Flavobacterium rakeshii]|uniref:Uncharacterized protein n=1 Tax=Flavobacterium rakeshii TaxID=1038845 RepID=A0A6N8H9L3_9FLAO|nr:hypothetical protein [Flavobacterium rakeshii]MUV03309.1 hypothetical protein [Flavobacterium rakeshii]
MDFIQQHSDDGKIKIRVSTITAYRLSNDGVNAEVLLSDGNWIRTATSLSKLEAMLM